MLQHGIDLHFVATNCINQSNLEIILGALLKAYRKQSKALKTYAAKPTALSISTGEAWKMKLKP